MLIQSVRNPTCHGDPGWERCSFPFGRRKQPEGPVPRVYKYLALPQNFFSFFHVFSGQFQCTLITPVVLVQSMPLAHHL